MKPPSASLAALPPVVEDPSAQDWSEEAARAAQAARAADAEPHRLFTEFRRKLALGEALARAFEKLLAALRFTGRITFSFHQGKLTKTVLEEAYFRTRPPGRETEDRRQAMT
jgi:signal transduction histidine kinase